MLTLAILMAHAFPGPQHLVHCIYYLARAGCRKDTFPAVYMDQRYPTPRKWSDLWILPIVTICLTPPQYAIADFAFVPYFIQHTMGYPSPVWLTIGHGALFTAYLGLRPQCILAMIAAFAHRYIRKDRIQQATLVAAIAHFALIPLENNWNFTPLSVCTTILIAEAKLHMQWQHEWVPPVEHIFAVPAYIGNLLLHDWAHRWKYTDKVWNSPDVLFVAANIAGAMLIHINNTHGVV